MGLTRGYCTHKHMKREREREREKERERFVYLDEKLCRAMHLSQMKVGQIEALGKLKSRTLIVI